MNSGLVKILLTLATAIITVACNPFCKCVRSQAIHTSNRHIDSHLKPDTQRRLLAQPSRLDHPQHHAFRRPNPRCPTSLSLLPQLTQPQRNHLRLHPLALVRLHLPRLRPPQYRLPRLDKQLVQPPLPQRNQPHRRPRRWKERLQRSYISSLRRQRHQRPPSRLRPKMGRRKGNPRRRQSYRTLLQRPQHRRLQPLHLDTQFARPRRHRRLQIPAFLSPPGAHQRSACSSRPHQRRNPVVSE